jgi:nucleotidyltransferase/DNA polymerase involved in DNA repair
MRSVDVKHGRALEDRDLPVGVRWGVGDAIAQKFAQEGFFVVLTTRNKANAAALAEATREQGGECMIVELDLRLAGLDRDGVRHHPPRSWRSRRSGL